MMNYLEKYGLLKRWNLPQFYLVFLKFSFI